MKDGRDDGRGKCKLCKHSLIAAHWAVSNMDGGGVDRGWPLIWCYDCQEYCGDNNV